MHHLLLAEIGGWFPVPGVPGAGAPSVVATSGNRTDEPICIDEREALQRLGRIAELFLVHDRPIARPVDDAVARVVVGQEQLLRRARGYAPLPIVASAELPPLLAVGAHLKNTIAVAVGRELFISQHVGDLETPQAVEQFGRTARDLQTLYALQPQAVACDAHPAYYSTTFAERCGLPVIRVQHHYAHVLACLGEHGAAPPALGAAWDGTGFGLDGTIWGGEFLRILDDGFARVAHLRTFRLPGGDQAVREPRRAALGVLYEVLGDALFGQAGLAPVRACTTEERRVFRAMLARDCNAPRTSSMGRFFDAMASLLDVRQRNRCEGEAAMALEWLLDGVATDDAYDWCLAAAAPPAPLVLDWEPMVRGVLHDLSACLPVARIAARFHNTLVEMLVTVAQRVGEPCVALTGGCFQNRYLTERAVQGLRAAGFQPLWHQRVPPNDGGIAVGQLIAAGRRRPGS